MSSSEHETEKNKEQDEELLRRAHPSADTTVADTLPRPSRHEIVKELELARAQLRHAYQQLIGPDDSWARAQRLDFADGLIGPHIVRLEAVILALQFGNAPKEHSLIERARAEVNIRIMRVSKHLSSHEFDAIHAAINALIDAVVHVHSLNSAKLESDR